jgi:hypothetical protein
MSKSFQYIRATHSQSLWFQTRRLVAGLASYLVDLSRLDVLKGGLSERGGEKNHRTIIATNKPEELAAKRHSHARGEVGTRPEKGSDEF